MHRQEYIQKIFDLPGIESATSRVVPSVYRVNYTASYFQRHQMFPDNLPLTLKTRDHIVERREELIMSYALELHGLRNEDS